MKRQYRQKQQCVDENSEPESSKSESDSEYVITETSESERQKSKTIWSLKGLSYQISHLVNELKTTTYKQLASILIERLQIELQKIQASERRKEIQNLKRRVYDAINVMVAMGLLTKDKKIISFQEQGLVKEEINYQEQSVQIKQQILNEKRKQLTKATLTYLKFQQLADRNQQIKLNEDMTALQTPVIGFSIQLYENDLIMQQKQQCRLLIKSKQPIHAYSELEILQKVLI